MRDPDIFCPMEMPSFSPRQIREMPDHWGWSIAFARRFLADWDDAEDVVGDVFAKIHALPYEIGDDKFKVYLRRSLRNAIVDKYREGRQESLLDPTVLANFEKEAKECILERTS